MENSLKKNFIWNAFGNIVYLGCQWLVTVLVARLAGYEDAGILSLAMSISATFQTIAMFGIRNFQVSDISCKYSDSCYVGFRNVTCLAAFLMCIVFSLMNGYSADMIFAITWFMIYRIAEDYSDVLHGIFQKNDKLYIAGQSFFIKGIATIVSFLSGYYIFGTLNGGLAVMAIVSVAETILFDYIRAHRISSFSLFENHKSCIALAKETLPLCVYMFLNSIIATAPKYILEKMCDSELLGAYSSIFAPALLIQAAAQYIYIPFISRFALLYQEGRIKDFISLAAKILAAILILGMLFLALSLFAGSWGLKLLFGASIEQYSGLLTLIIVATFTTAINAFLQAIAVVIRDFKGLVISCIVGIVLSCAVSYLLISVVSADGASLGLISGTLAGSIFLVFAIIKRIKVTFATKE